MIQISDLVCRCFEAVGLMDDDLYLVVEAFHNAVINRRIEVVEQESFAGFSVRNGTCSTPNTAKQSHEPNGPKNLRLVMGNVRC